MLNKILFQFLCIMVIGSDVFSGDWELYTVDNSGISSNSILVAKSMGPDEMWFGTYDHGVSILDEGMWTELNSQNSSLPSDRVTAIAKDNSGFIWIGTDNGLVRYNGIAMEEYNSSNGADPKKLDLS